MAGVQRMRFLTRARNRASVCRMGHPVRQWAVHLLATKHSVSVLELYGFAALVECKQLLQVGLYYTETCVDGWVAESVREKTEVGQAWVGIVGVVGFDVARTTDCIQHRLKF